MRVLVTGATGFVGGHVVKHLLDAGMQVTTFGRLQRSTELPATVASLQGDVVTSEGLAAAMSGVDAVVHLVGIIRERGGATFERVHVEGTRNVLAAAARAGVPRLVHMSALGAGVGSSSGYHRSKAAAEELVRSSAAAWTIMRPSLIFGVGDAFFGGTLRNLVTQPPVIPVVGSGEYPFSPVWIDDVATAFVRALERPTTVGGSFDLVGPREYTLRELLVLVRETLGLNKPLVNIPLPLMRVGVALFRLLPNPPITRDELIMLLAGNTGDPRPAVEAFGLELAALEEHLATILSNRRSRQVLRA